MIYDFIKDICDILNIKTPSVSFDVSIFPTATTLAACSPDGLTIHLKEYNKPNPDQLFAIAHELRHIWQIQTDEKLYFADYKPSNLTASVEEYNLQFAEIDANAFAGLIMVDAFGLSPLFNGVSDIVKSKISERMSELALSYDV